MAAGVAAGALARNAPVAIVLALVRGEEAADCGEGSAATIECVFELLPRAVGAIVLFGAQVIATATVLAAVGVLALVLGAARLARPAPAADGGDGDEERADVPGLVAVGLGTALVVPAVWLLGAVVVAIVSGA